jgi:diacylglycerol kinase family enzyme
VVNGMAGSRVPLAILPAGTANVLAMELGLGSRIQRVIPRIANSVPERVSLGLLHNALGSRYFLLMAGVGLDAEIVYNLNLDLKKSLGKLAYWIAGFSHIVRPMAQFDARICGRSTRAGFALASRVRNYGGDLEIARGANLLEDDFETILFSGKNPLRYMAYFSAVVVRMLPRVPGITIERCRKIEFACPTDQRIHVQVDGEYAGGLPATVEIVQDALTIMTPADFRERLGLRITEALMPAAG